MRRTSYTSKPRPCKRHNKTNNGEILLRLNRLRLRRAFHAARSSSSSLYIGTIKTAPEAASPISHRDRVPTPRPRRAESARTSQFG